jgi:hypothetical protein
MNKKIPMIAVTALLTVSTIGATEALAQGANAALNGNTITYTDAGQTKHVAVDHVSRVSNSNQFDGKLVIIDIEKSSSPEVIYFNTTQEARSFFKSVNKRVS